jgi:hypothetical protein
MSLAPALGSIHCLTYSCPIIKIIPIIQAFKQCKEAITLVFKGHIHEFDVKVIGIGPRIHTATC